MQFKNYPNNVTMIITFILKEPKTFFSPLKFSHIVKKKLTSIYFRRVNKE